MQLHRLARVLFLAAVPFAFAACGDEDEGTGPDGSSGGDAIPTLSSGLTPSISWSGANARNITLVEMQNGQPVNSYVWSVTSTNPSVGFPSPVAYGEVPSGSAQLAPAAALKAGTTYRVTLALVDGKGGFRDVTR